MFAFYLLYEFFKIGHFYLFALAYFSFTKSKQLHNLGFEKHFGIRSEKHPIVIFYLKFEASNYNT